MKIALHQIKAEKKSVFRTGLAVVSLSMLLAGSSMLSGCSTKEQKDAADQVSQEESNQQEESGSGDASGSKEEISGDSELSSYVTLGQYKGLEYTKVDTEISEEELKEAIDRYVEENAKAQVTDRAVEQGDTINLDFAGYVDGEAFEGGTSEGYQLVIGSGSMIPGFEEAIVGMMPGETAPIDVTFPEEYRKEGTPGSEMNGKAAIFDITVNYIIEPLDLKYNQKFIEEYTEFDTREEFEADLKNSLQEEKQEEAESSEKDELFGKLVDNAEIHKLPEEEVKKYHDNLIASYQSMADSVDLELADFLEQYYGVTEEDLDAYAKEYAELMATQAVIFQSIAQIEGITVSEEEYQEGLDSYYEMMGNTYESREAFEEEMAELLREALLYEKVEQFIMEQAVAV